MHEVIHLSFGPQANELNSHFYNSQQSYFVFSKNDLPHSHVDPGIRFVNGKEYTPRAAFWDYRNGFSRYRMFNSRYEEPQSEERISSEQERPVTSVPKDDISPSLSWTSRVKVRLHPSNLHTIPDWETDPELFPFGHQRGAPRDEQREFDNISEGVAQFKETCRPYGGKPEDYLDVTIRPMFEKCDLIDGVNVLTDLGGWSGFTSPLIECMRDEYTAKSSVFTWCISRKATRFSKKVERSRLEALCSFAEFSDLVIPLQDYVAARTALDFVQNAANCLARFETVSLLSSLRRKRVSMFQLSQDLTCGVPGANIVDCKGSVGVNESILELSGSASRVRNTVKILRGNSGSETSKTSEKLALDRSQNYREYVCPQPLINSARELENFTLEVNDKPLNFKKLVGSGDHEFRERVLDTVEPYIWGWNDPSDESD